MKRMIVIALEEACTATDRVPWLWGLLGCRMARWSAALDERWGTGVWRAP